MAALRYDQQHVAVLGLGATGMSLVRHLHARGACVRVFDERAPELLEGARAALPEAVPLERIDGDRDRLPAATDWVALSPGFPRAKRIVQSALASGRPVWGDIELFARELDPGTRVLAITGSNGKTTTTALAGVLVRAQDASAQTAGNIGEPVLEALARAPATRTWVLELSSFQLESTESLAPTAATVLNVSPNHLDRYPSFFDYAASKARIYARAERRVANRDCAYASQMVAEYDPSVRRFGLDRPQRLTDYGLAGHDAIAWLVQGERAFCRADELRLAGRHQWANALAALALCEPAGGWSDSERERAAALLKSFRGLPHRMALLGSIDGVRVIDDSKATTEAATQAALEGLAEPGVGCIHLIAGGDGKGQSFRDFGQAVARAGARLYLIGRDAPRLAAASAPYGIEAQQFARLEEATRAALERARPGDIVLLSPACASWDMFQSYRERAEVFHAAVVEWANARGKALEPPREDRP
ncbi:MAG: UDP-N-acetylmuramoyl-L-alanine--D-glutamate ligase [Casimicrobiaceae bacterium]|nr:UDP-N-acetylmuramoyl-L-alanine--D-glutamate ligase [Casimicrobiaceae bacterium]